MVMKKKKAFYKTTVKISKKGKSEVELLEEVTRQAQDGLAMIPMEIHRVDIQEDGAVVYFSRQAVAPAFAKRILSTNGGKFKTVKSIKEEEVWDLP